MAATIDKTRQPMGEQVEAQVEAQVDRCILFACAKTPLSSAEIASSLGHAKPSGNLRKALPRVRMGGLLEYTIPGKTNSRLQRYRLTAKGRQWLEQQQEAGNRLVHWMASR
jgi:DNA-binding PadR family transcriptional regulator